MQPTTHLAIDPTLCGVPHALSEGAAEVHLETTAAMAADAEGLVHGGFVFGAADYAAMLAVGDPLVVLGGAECRFLAPVRVGQEVVLDARADRNEGRKRVVVVTASVAGSPVFEGTFTAFVLQRHVLDGRP